MSTADQRPLLSESSSHNTTTTAAAPTTAAEAAADGYDSEEIETVQVGFSTPSRSCTCPPSTTAWSRCQYFSAATALCLLGLLIVDLVVLPVAIRSSAQGSQVVLSMVHLLDSPPGRPSFLNMVVNVTVQNVSLPFYVDLSSGTTEVAYGGQVFATSESSPMRLPATPKNATGVSLAVSSCGTVTALGPVKALLANYTPGKDVRLELRLRGYVVYVPLFWGLSLPIPGVSVEGGQNNTFTFAGELDPRGSNATDALFSNYLAGLPTAVEARLTSTNPFFQPFLEQFPLEALFPGTSRPLVVQIFIVLPGTATLLKELLLYRSVEVVAKVVARNEFSARVTLRHMDIVSFYHGSRIGAAQGNVTLEVPPRSTQILTPDVKMRIAADSGALRQQVAVFADEVRDGIAVVDAVGVVRVRLGRVEAAVRVAQKGVPICAYSQQGIDACAKVTGFKP